MKSPTHWPPRLAYSLNSTMCVAKSMVLATFVLVATGPSYAESLRSTSIPSSLADDEKRLLPEVMAEFYGSFGKEKSCWISKQVLTRTAPYM